MIDFQRVENVLQGLRSLQDSSLSIIRLSEPISATPTSHRTSDVSTSAFDNPSPESLEADLSHYKVHTYIIFPILKTYKAKFQLRAGTLLQTPLLLPRTSDQGEIPPRHRRRSSPNSRACREHRTGTPAGGGQSRVESTKGTCRGNGHGVRRTREGLEQALRNDLLADDTAIVVATAD